MSMMPVQDEEELRRWATRAEKLAREAGELILKGRERGFDTTVKSGVVSVATKMQESLLPNIH
jgi:hypothetical protein